MCQGPKIRVRELGVVVAALFEGVITTGIRLSASIGSLRQASHSALGTEGRLDSTHVAIVVAENDDLAVAVQLEVTTQNLRLVATEFEKKSAAGSQIARTVANDSAKDVNAFGTTVVGQGRFEVERAARQQRQTRCRNVGYDADDDVDRAVESVWQWSKEVTV